MTIIVDATYENGQLKPLQPLELAEGVRVRLTIASDAAQLGEPLDPLAEVIGICTGGPPDGADRHDDYVYGDFRR